MTITQKNISNLKCTGITRMWDLSYFRGSKVLSYESARTRCNVRQDVLVTLSLDPESHHTHALVACLASRCSLRQKHFSILVGFEPMTFELEVLDVIFCTKIVFYFILLSFFFQTALRNI